MRRIDDYRRQILHDGNDFVAVLGYLSSNLMDALVACQPGIQELLAQDASGRRQVADRQRILATYLQFHRQIVHYGRLIADLKKQGGDWHP